MNHALLFHFRVECRDGTDLGTDDVDAGGDEPEPGEEGRVRDVVPPGEQDDAPAGE